MTGVELSENGFPLHEERSIRLRYKIGRAKLTKKFLCGAIGETNISADKVLIQNRCTQEIAHLLLLDRITREGEGMAAAGEDGAGDMAIDRGEKSECTFFKGENCITTAELDAIGGSDVIDGGGIDAQSLDGIIQFVRLSLRRRANYRCQETPQREKSY